SGPMKTFSSKSQTVVHDWTLVDASDQTLGRLASLTAHRLRGTHKPEFSPHVDAGGYTVVVNVERHRVTGRNAQEQMYHRHTGYPGGIKGLSYEKLMEKAPDRALALAVKGMLPRGPLGRAMYRKLKIYAGDTHPHAAQQPRALAI